MLTAQIYAQEVSLNVPEGGGEWVFWLIGAGVILGLYLVIRRTRKRAYDDYWDRRRRDEERRRNDPDMANPEDPA